MAEQLALFNLIDRAPMAAAVPVRPIAPRPAPSLKPPAPPPSWRGNLKLMDMVVVLPFKTPNGTEHGGHLKEPGVIVGFNDRAEMVRIDVGVPGLFYEASPWRVVKMDA